MHIFIVEDDYSTCKALETLLLDKGHTVCWSTTVQGAIKLLHTEPIDLVLLDVMIETEFGGLEVARRVPRGIPIFIISGSDPTIVRAEARTNALEGIQYWFDKPIDIARLCQAIEAIVT
jgi:DNA-binding response OmpR family regulator